MITNTVEVDTLIQIDFDKLIGIICLFKRKLILKSIKVYFIFFTKLYKIKYIYVF
jgi:hypothetical protein